MPTLDAVSEMLLREHDVDYPRLEKIAGRRLTETEASAADSMGSEHASYGSSRFHLKTILPVNGPNHVKGIGDEAATAAIWVDPATGATITMTYSSESHNYPSYVCAHPGAATGTGGQERDNIVQTATRVDAIYESRRQCHPLHNPHKDPVKQHTDETTKGIADYGNAMGIPHGDGAMKYHSQFSGNNLVNVAGVTIASKSRLCRNKVPTTDSPDKFVGIYIGKASDTTGLGGTKAASTGIDMTNADLNEKAVQDPDPHLQEADTRGIEIVFDTAIREGWADKISIKDMGAAGLLCSTSEQCHGIIGMVINGDLVPQNEPRTSLELEEAETQERFFISVHEDYAEKVLHVFNDVIGLPHINKGACAKVVARYNDTGRYTFIRDGVIDVDLPVADLKAGPLMMRPVKEPKSRATPIPETTLTLEQQIRKVLGSINFKSDEYVYSHYDRHVRSTNIVKRGEGCATLRTHPLLKKKIGYSFSFDSNCVYGILDPKKQAEDSLVRGAWKMAAVGCSVIGLTNNANYGRTTVPEEMWEFVKGQEGIAKACYRWELEQDYLDAISQDEEIAGKMKEDERRHVTVNSGNCSLNKANANTGTAIPPTTILGLAGWTNSPENYAKWDLKDEDSTLYLIGERQAALGGSDYLQVLHGPDCVGDKLFDIDYDQAQKEVNAVIHAVRSGIVSAANAIEEGGLCNAVAEMVANTKHKVDVDIFAYMPWGGMGTALEHAENLFSENYGMVLQVSNDKRLEFEKMMRERGVRPIDVGKCRRAEKKDGNLRFYIRSNEDCSLPQGAVRDMYHPKLERMLDKGQRIITRGAA